MSCSVFFKNWVIYLSMLCCVSNTLVYDNLCHMQSCQCQELGHTWLCYLLCCVHTGRGREAGRHTPLTPQAIRLDLLQFSLSTNCRKQILVYDSLRDAHNVSLSVQPLHTSARILLTVILSDLIYTCSAKKILRNLHLSHIINI